jgi:putative phosphoesterase
MKGMVILRLLVLSDSHSGLSFMRRAVSCTKPDAIVHLGDYVADAQCLREEHPGISFYQVAGNCDRYHSMHPAPEILTVKLGGVIFYLTHGHLHGVKMYTDSLERAARDSGAQIVLYGHTHRPDCRLERGLYILNPGTCCSSNGSVGLVEIRDGKITDCRVLGQPELEALA